MNVEIIVCALGALALTVIAVVGAFMFGLAQWGETDG